MEERYIQQFKKGSLEMILLALISRRETYGYEILTELNWEGADVLGFAKEGTVYPILYRLQNGGLIQCRLAPAPANGGTKKYYSLTKKGRDTLRELTAFWSRYKTCVDRFLSGPAPEKETDRQREGAAGLTEADTWQTKMDSQPEGTGRRQEVAE